MTKTLWALAALLVAASAARATTIASSNDLLFTVGSGANLATLIIDFQDGASTESFAWGYRWDGTASGEDMITSIAAADPNLTIDSGSFVGSVQYFDGQFLHSATSDFGNFLSWGYYVVGGFAGDDMPFVPGGTPLPVPGGGTDLPASWTISPSGASLVSLGDSGRILSDGSWDAWSFGSYNSTTFVHEVPPGPEAPTAAVPEPTRASLLLLALLASALRRRRP
ncbi:MAG: PEP-CTERM sorting domain-containing protein [Verrucomicrobiota bacterium]